MNRRKFIAAASAGAIAAIAGCSSAQREDADSTDSDFPIKQASINNNALYLEITPTHNVLNGGFEEANKAYLLNPDGRVEDETDLVVEQTTVVFEYNSGNGTYQAVLISKTPEENAHYLAAAEVRITDDEAVLVEKWYRDL